jgi:hypothetical protein
MPIDVDATRSWAKEHKAAWEVEPLFEMRGAERVQVGYELDLYVRLPAGLPTAEQAFTALWDCLREIAESLLPLVGEQARMEVEPFEAAGRLRPETGFAPEVLLQARLFHATDYFAPAGDQDRDRLRPIEERLAQLGLRARSW